MRRILPTSFLLALLTAAPAAWAGDGSAQNPSYGGAGYGELTEPEQEVDRNAATEVQKPKPKPKPKRKRQPQAGGSGGRPLLVSFAVASSRLYVYGRSTRVSYRIDDRAPTVDVKLHIVNSTSGEVARTVELGSQATGVDHVYRLNARGLPGARYRVRVTASDPGGKRLTRRPGVSALDEIAVYGHRFPLKGNFPYGEPGSRFGDQRSGHIHQGQDIAAPEGTPVMAPRGGRVTTVAYQGSGAGHYVVIDGAGENRHYVFMHLVDGSIRVREGQWVRTGKRIGSVGNTGRSFGAHLHFEIWKNGWWGNGEAVDPYRLLRSWDRWS